MLVLPLNNGQTPVVSFQRDLQNRITTITDPQNNVYRYSYDSPTNGDLTSVTLPNSANNTPEAYTYSYFTSSACPTCAHLYQSSTDPMSHTVASTDYYTDGRLYHVTDAVSNRYTYTYGDHQTTKTNPDSSFQVTTYDIYGDVLTSQDELGHITTNTYDTVTHNLLSSQQPSDPSIPNNQPTYYGYDTKGNRTCVTNPLGYQVLSLTYNQYSGPQTLSNLSPTSTPTATTCSTAASAPAPDSTTWTVGYDTNYRPSGITDALGSVGSNTYYDNGSIKTQTDGNGNLVHSFTYDAYGNLQTDKDALGHTANYTYDTLGRLTNVKDANGNTTVNGYDALGNLTSVTVADSFTNILQNVSYTYDANGNKTSETVGSETTSYVYYSDNHLKTVTYADTSTVDYTYDYHGNTLIEVRKDKNRAISRTTTNVYDKSGRLMSVKITGYNSAATPMETDFTYYNNGLRASETVRNDVPLLLSNGGSVNSAATNYTYNAAGQLLTVTDPMSNVTTYNYDANGMQTSVVTGSHTTQYSYDIRGHQTQILYPGLTNFPTLPSSSQQTFVQQNHIDQQYDLDGHLMKRTDLDGITTQYGYYANGQLNSVTDGLNNPSTKYTYDYAGNQQTITDANGNVTTFGYDGLNRLISKKLPHAAANDTQITESFGYDPIYGNQTSHQVKGSDGTVWSSLISQFDSMNRPLTISYSDGSNVNYSNYSYTADGQLNTVTDTADPHGIMTYGYDAFDRLNSVSQPGQATVNYTYDVMGDRTQMLVGGVPTNYTYTANNQLHTVDNGGPALATYTYDQYGMRYSLALGNGITTYYTYDPLNRLTNMFEATSGSSGT